jgi:hypothetical protein
LLDQAGFDARVAQATTAFPKWKLLGGARSNNFSPFSLLRYIVPSFLAFFLLTLSLPSGTLLRVYLLFNSNRSAPKPPAPKIATNPFQITSLREITI